MLHTSDGRTYLYLQHLDDNDYRYVNVFRLDQGMPSYVGYEGMAWYNAQILDPDSFMLYTRLDVLGTYYGMKRYHVDEAGLPASDDEAYVINESSMLRSTRDLAVTILEKNGSETEATVPSGTRLHHIPDRRSFLCGRPLKRWPRLPHPDKRRKQRLGLGYRWSQRGGVL